MAQTNGRKDIRTDTTSYRAASGIYKDWGYLGIRIQLRISHAEGLRGPCWEFAFYLSRFFCSFFADFFFLAPMSRPFFLVTFSHNPWRGSVRLSVQSIAMHRSFPVFFCFCFCIFLSWLDLFISFARMLSVKYRQMWNVHESYSETLLPWYSETLYPVLRSKWKKSLLLNQGCESGRGASSRWVG